MKSICVFCGASQRVNELHLANARRIGTLIAKNNCRLIFGGCSCGSMGAVADSALQNGAEVVGVVPDQTFREELIHDSLTKLHFVSSMHERKTLMSDLADGFIALPGGIGTVDETIEITTWSQLGIHNKPFGLLNPDGYFDLLLSFLDKMVADDFMPSTTREYLQAHEDPEVLFNSIVEQIKEEL